MPIIRLPSGQEVQTPEGLTRDETLEYMFEKMNKRSDLFDPADIESVGDKLDTSGWGAAAGSIIGAGLGTIATPFTGGIVNPITGGVAGGAAGEAIEQYFTGRGDLRDVASEGIWGLLPGGGAQLIKQGVKQGAKVGLKETGKLAAKGAGVGGAATTVGTGDPSTGLIGGAVAGTIGAVIPGAPKLVNKIWGDASKRISRELGGELSEDTSEAAGKALSDILTGKIKAKLGRPTGAFQAAQGILDLRRIAFREVKKLLGLQGFKLTRKESNLVKKQVEEALSDTESIRQLEREARQEYLEAQRQSVQQPDLFPHAVETVKPRLRQKKHKGVDVYEDQNTGELYDMRGNTIGDFALGGIIGKAISKKGKGLIEDFARKHREGGGTATTLTTQEYQSILSPADKVKHVNYPPLKSEFDELVAREELTHSLGGKYSAVGEDIPSVIPEALTKMKVLADTPNLSKAQTKFMADTMRTYVKDFMDQAYTAYKNQDVEALLALKEASREIPATLWKKMDLPEFDPIRFVSDPKYHKEMVDEYALGNIEGIKRFSKQIPQQSRYSALGDAWTMEDGLLDTFFKPRHSKDAKAKSFYPSEGASRYSGNFSAGGKVKGLL